MAVYTPLENDVVAQLVSLYPEASSFVSFKGVAAGSSNSVYEVVCENERFFLRVNEGKSEDDILFELVVLEHLKKNLEHPMAARVMRDAGGRFLIPLIQRGERYLPFVKGIDAVDASLKFACLFEALEGRELASFECSNSHIESVGGALARAHVALETCGQRRENPYSLERLLALSARLPSASAKVQTLRSGLRKISGARKPIKSGLIHGDLFRNNTKWKRGKLVAVFDWEMAAREHLMFDVAVAINAWAVQENGTTVSYRDDAVRAFLSGYQSVRAFDKDEIAAFYTEMQLAALRFAATRLRDFPESDAPAPTAEVISIQRPHRRKTRAKVRDHLDPTLYLERYRLLVAAEAESSAQERYFD